MSGPAPLAGIKVADFGQFIAAPLCGAVLGDMGAEVIRIERPGGSEDRVVTSFFYRPDGTAGEGPSFLQLNRNKRAISIDLTAPEGAEVIRRVVEWADIVVANFPRAVLAKLGLDYESVRAINPRAILVAITGFGTEGPYADRIAFDPIAQAMTGVTWLSGTEDNPQRTQATWVDFGTGMMSAYGALAALRARDRTGEGQLVSTSLFGTSLNVFAAYLMEQAVKAPNRVPHGNRGHTAGPVDVFRCTDGSIFLACQSNPVFRRWARTVGKPELIDDPRFADDVSRGTHGKLLGEIMQDWCKEMTVEETIATLEAGRVPAAPVLSLQQVLDDPHVAATGAFIDTEFPGIDRPVPVPKSPLVLSGYQPPAPRRAPMIGEDNDALYAELGFDAETVADWRARGIV